MKAAGNHMAIAKVVVNLRTQKVGNTKYFCLSSWYNRKRKSILP